MAIKKQNDLQISADGTIPVITGDIKVKYSKHDINTNWLLNRVLGTKHLQITKISDNELMQFLNILNTSRLKMPDGTDSLEWLKRRLVKRYNDSTSQRGMTWENISRRYRFILQQIDILLVTKPLDDH